MQAADTALNLKPEDIENYEAGLKGSVLGGRLALEASYFYMTEDGVVINRFVNNRFIPSNAGQLKYKGFESGATWTPTQKLTAYVNGAFYRNRYGDFVIQSSSGDTTLTGNRLILSPDYIVNWGASVLPVPAVNITFDVKHVSSTFGNDINTARIDGYTLVDAACDLAARSAPRHSIGAQPPQPGVLFRRRQFFGRSWPPPSGAPEHDDSRALVQVMTISKPGPSALVKRSLIVVHRWLGVALSVIFLIWFVSGIVMMYWSFPGISARDRLQRAPTLDPARITVSPEQAFAALNRDPEYRASAPEQFRRPTCLSFRRWRGSRWYWTRGRRRDGLCG